MMNRTHGTVVEFVRRWPGRYRARLHKLASKQLWLWPLNVSWLVTTPNTEITHAFVFLACFSLCCFSSFLFRSVTVSFFPPDGGVALCHRVTDGLVTRRHDLCPTVFKTVIVLFAFVSNLMINRNPGKICYRVVPTNIASVSGGS